jgi:ketosteroid isomerase-like protein
MSQENVELARHIIELTNRGDYEGVAALLAPDVECFPAADQPESEPFRGVEAFLRYARGWEEAFEKYVIEPTEILDRGECVVMVGQITARGRGSGVETTDEDAAVYRFRDGQVVEYRECGTKARALEAVGLSE